MACCNSLSLFCKAEIYQFALSGELEKELETKPPDTGGGMAWHGVLQLSLFCRLELEKESECAVTSLQSSLAGQGYARLLAERSEFVRVVAHAHSLVSGSNFCVVSQFSAAPPCFCKQTAIVCCLFFPPSPVFMTEIRNDRFDTRNLRKGV